VHRSRFRRAVLGWLTAGLLAVVVSAGVPAFQTSAGAEILDSSRVDVLFVFDTTGSMSGALSEAKSQVLLAIDTIRGKYADANFGIAAVADYPPDVPWSLKQPITADGSLVQEAINPLYAAGGGDGPEAYGRALYEAVNDSDIGWRTDAKRLLVLVNDNVPHDNDLNEDVPAEIQTVGSPFSTGTDLGRDGVAGTDDDIDWQAALRNLQEARIVLADVFYSGSVTYLPYWQWWTEQTGGTTEIAGGSTPLGEVLSGLVTSSIIQDVDGDGLPDSWEEYGLYGGDGSLRLVNLPGLGAKKDHKDIFVYVDYERGAMLSSKAISILQKSFAAAPVSNPDKKTGINLHVIKGDEVSASISNSLRKSDGDPDYEKIWDQWTYPGGKSVFHYALSVRWENWDFAGESNNIPGQLMVLNNYGANDTDQAANLMHELGHNLNLHHGGNDEDPFKPNYLSVMSYNFNHTGIPNIGVTYSRWGPESLNVLDENSLSEPAGITSPDNSVPAKTRTWYYCPNNGKKRWADIGKATDWDCRGGARSNYVSGNIDFPNRYRTDPFFIKFCGPKNELKSHDDWRALIYAGGQIGTTKLSFIDGIPVAA
jgi:hypothetical protein